MRTGLSQLLIPALILSVGAVSQAQAPVSAPAQPLAERVKDSCRTWDALLERGEAGAVRRITEGLLSKEALSVSSADYREMQAVVALRGYAARACVLEGAWEEGVAHLQKASAAASDNLTVTEGTFSRLKAEHEGKLKDWGAEVAGQEQRLKDLEAQPGLNSDQMQLRSQIRTYLEERRAAITHSAWALKEMDTYLAQLRKEKEAYGTSLLGWQGFLDREKVDLAQGPRAYAASKLAQVKADDARPRFERLAYGRRLQRLDPTNTDVLRFVNGLLGKEEESEKPAPRPRKKTGKK